MTKFIENLFVALCVVVVVMVDCGLAVAGVWSCMNVVGFSPVVWIIVVAWVVVVALAVDFGLLWLATKAMALTQRIAKRIAERIDWQIEYTSRTLREIKWQLFTCTQAQRETWMPWTYANGSVYAQLVKWVAMRYETDEMKARSTKAVVEPSTQGVTDVALNNDAILNIDVDLSIALGRTLTAMYDTTKLLPATTQTTQDAYAYFQSKHESFAHPMKNSTALTHDEFCAFWDEILDSQAKYYRKSECRWVDAVEMTEAEVSDYWNVLYAPVCA